MDIDVTPEEARNIKENSVADTENVSIENEIRRAAWNGHNSTVVKEIRRKWSNDEIREIRVSLEKMGYHVNIGPEMGFGPACMTIWWSEEKPFN